MLQTLSKATVNDSWRESIAGIQARKNALTQNQRCSSLSGEGQVRLRAIQQHSSLRHCLTQHTISSHEEQHASPTSALSFFPPAPTPLGKINIDLSNTMRGTRCIIGRRYCAARVTAHAITDIVAISVQLETSPSAVFEQSVRRGLV